MKSKISSVINKISKKKVCRHDYKNAIKVGNINYQCPLCGIILDPNEWFIMNSFTFVDEVVVKTNAGKKGGGIAKRARIELENKTGKKIVSGQNYLQSKNFSN